MASELGQSLGKPWEVTEEAVFDLVGSMGRANFQTREQFAMPLQQEGPTIAGGEVTIRSTVRVSFQLE